MNARFLFLAAVGLMLVPGAYILTSPTMLETWFPLPAGDAGTDGSPSASGPSTSPSTPVPAGDEAASVNPLNKITLDSLNEIVERPLFNPARAAPKIPVTQPAPVQEAVASAPPPEGLGPDDLTLLAVAVIGTERIALLKLNKTSEVVQLRAGESHADWMLKDVGEKAVTIASGDGGFELKMFEDSRLRPREAPPAFRRRSWTVRIRATTASSSPPPGTTRSGLPAQETDRTQWRWLR